MHVRSDIDEPPAKRCKFCDEPARDADTHTLWFLTLDLDLFNWIKDKYPNWFSNRNTTTNPTEYSTSNNTLCSSVVTSKIMAEGEQPAAPSTVSDSPLLGSVEDYNSRQSPPKVVVDTTPLQPQMDKNKESLKVKLMLRRTADQLADIGIYPSLTTSPALHEQRKQLERAKTGDLLKAKIQQRPDRRELERRHILEHEESFVDPSLAEKQRMLKKARLADQLSSQITHRPGPLELIKKNILHTEEPIERIVKEGLVTFKPTSEGLLSRPQHPNSYTVFEDDSQSSEGDVSSSPLRQDVLEAAAASAGIVTVTIPTSGGAVVVTPVLPAKYHPTLFTSASYVPPPPPPPPPLLNNIKTETFSIKNNETSTPNLFAELCQSVAGTITGNTSLLIASSPSSLGSTLSPISSISSPPGSSTPRPIPSPLQQNCQKTDAPGKDKNRKKSKSKPITKERTIKFHEYKGPPNSQKNNISNSLLSGCNNSLSNSKKVEEWYQICLNQQNCLVDLEGYSKQKTILPAPQNEVSQPSPSPSNASSIPASPAPSFTHETNSNHNINISSNNNNSNNININNNNNSNNISSIELNKLEKMKVSDLKMQLKKRNLPVSGPKPQLIERLKPYLPLDLFDNKPVLINGDTCDVDTNYNSPKNSLSPESEHDCNMMDVQQDSPPTLIINNNYHGRQTPSLANDDLVREQQRQIDELQRQLKEKQEELLQMKIQTQPSNVTGDKQQETINQKLKFKQHLEAKIYKEKLQQIENLNRQNLLLKNNQMNSINNNQIYITTIKDEPITIKNEPITSIHNNSNNSLELVWNNDSQPPTLVLVDLNSENKKLINGHHRTSSMPSILVPITTPSPLSQTKPTIEIDLKPPPPQYDEATKSLENNNNNNITHNRIIKTEPTGNSNIKSQDMSDVLEILINNGELPESVLSSTPTTPSTTTITYNHQHHIGDPNLSLVQDSLLFDPSSLHHSSDSNNYASLILETENDVLNELNCMSPMQSEHHHNDIDETATKTLDMLLGQSTVVNSNHNHSNHNSDSNELKLNSSNINNNIIKLNDLDFNNWPVFELMKHQLEMDMGDDCSSPNQYTISNLNNNNNNNNLSKKRDMNPSLQPSLNEFISNSNFDYLNFNNDSNNSCNNSLNSNNTNNNNSNINFNNDTAMDVDFANSLSNFDLRTLTSSSQQSPLRCQNSDDTNNLLYNNHQIHQIQTPPHPFQSSSMDQSNQLQIHNHHDVFDLNLDDFNVVNSDQMSWEVDFTLMNCH